MTIDWINKRSIQIQLNMYFWCHLSLVLTLNIYIVWTSGIRHQGSLLLYVSDLYLYLYLHFMFIILHFSSLVRSVFLAHIYFHSFIFVSVFVCDVWYMIDYWLSVLNIQDLVFLCIMYILGCFVLSYFSLFHFFIYYLNPTYSDCWN